METSSYSFESETAKNNFEAILAIFKNTETNQDKYKIILELGSKKFLFPDIEKIESNLVPGCQSIVYLHANKAENGTIFFSYFSEALISSGLAYLATQTYSHLSPEEILKTPPFFIEHLGLAHSLTPGRSNGVMSMVNVLKKMALNFIIKR